MRRAVLKTIRQFFTPPVFPDDEDKTRTARILYALLANMTVVVALIVISAIWITLRNYFSPEIILGV